MVSPAQVIAKLVPLRLVERIQTAGHALTNRSGVRCATSPRRVNLDWPTLDSSTARGNVATVPLLPCLGLTASKLVAVPTLQCAAMVCSARATACVERDTFLKTSTAVLCNVASLVHQERSGCLPTPSRYVNFAAIQRGAKRELRHAMDHSAPTAMPARTGRRCPYLPPATPGLPAESRDLSLA